MEVLKPGNNQSQHQYPACYNKSQRQNIYQSFVTSFCAFSNGSKVYPQLLECLWRYAILVTGAVDK
jgi:hypothetical protein